MFSFIFVVNDLKKSLHIRFILYKGAFGCFRIVLGFEKRDPIKKTRYYTNVQTVASLSYNRLLL